jgi:YidC/Oxa1 family membrane protein insertase
MEFIFIISYKITGSYGSSIINLSIVISIIAMPLYMMAEKFQRSERDIQERMKRMKDNIKEVFKGDKRYMMLSTLYRQHNYHPLYALRSSFGLLIQIPIFLAAWHFILSIDLNTIVYYGIRLTSPDSLFIIKNVPDPNLGLKDIPIHILPIVMTLISLASAAVYSKGFSIKEKIPLYALPFIFLFLLYRLPSCIVLYWTCNNIFSFLRNIIKKTKLPKLVSSFLTLALTPVFMKKSAVEIKQGDTNYTSIFLLSSAALFLLGGLVVPSSLIETDVFNFSLVEGFKNPVLFIINAMAQSFGIFILWPLCIYYLFSQKTKSNMAKLVSALAVAALINVFVFPGDYGFLLSTFHFDEPIDQTGAAGYINLLVAIVVFMGILLFSLRFRKITVSIMAISVCALILAGTINIRHIQTEFKYIQSRLTPEKLADDPVYKFSKTGKNVLLIVLDRAVAGYVPYIFKEKPELYDSLDGFTWYRNTISFGEFTHYCMPALFGGYEYAPLESNARTDKTLVEKHNESFLLLPRIFIDQGFNVTVTDPTYAGYRTPPDLSIFGEYPQIHAENIIGKYTQHWLNENTYFKNHFETIALHLLHFSFFRLTPSVLRNFVYDDGKWLIVKRTEREEELIEKKTLHNYVTLDVLPDITEVSETEFNYYNSFINNLTHDPSYLQVPNYIPVNKVTNLGNGPLSKEMSYHCNIASFLLLGKWFDFLKENNVYDNSRIIIASDHGRNVPVKFQDNFALSNGKWMSAYHTLLLVKDFNAQGVLSVDDTFMTNADVPLIALDGIVENPVNPWTGKILKSAKENGGTLTTSSLSFRNTRFGNRFLINPDQWMHVHTNIFDPKNWSNVFDPEKLGNVSE